MSTVKNLKEVQLKDLQVRVRGQIMFITEPFAVGDNGTMKQNIVVYTAPYQNDFGEIKGKPQYWEFTIMGSANIEKFGLPAYQATQAETHRKVIVIAWVNSAFVKSKKTDGSDLYIANLNVEDLEVIP